MFFFFQKISIIVKNFKTFYDSETAIYLKGIISPSINKACYVTGAKSFERLLTGIYKHLLCNCFNNAVHGPSRNHTIQIFFLAPTRNCFYLSCGGIFYIILSGLRLVKWVRIFASVCWLWDFLPENLQLVDKLQTWGFNHLFFDPNFVFLGLF